MNSPSVPGVFVPLACWKENERPWNPGEFLFEVRQYWTSGRTAPANLSSDWLGERKSLVLYFQPLVLFVKPIKIDLERDSFGCRSFRQASTVTLKLGTRLGWASIQVRVGERYDNDYGNFCLEIMLDRNGIPFSHTFCLLGCLRGIASCDWDCLQPLYFQRTKITSLAKFFNLSPSNSNW